MIDIETDGNVGRLTINRPEQSNALDVEAISQLDAGYRRLDADPDVRVIVLRGSGRGFCSGHDLSPQPDRAPLEVMDDWDLLLKENRLLLSIWDGDTPVIAALHGYCLGHAVEIVNVCDLSVATDGCRFAHPAIRGASGSPNALTYPFALGLSRAKEYLWVTPEVRGPQAERWGLINSSVPDDQLEETVGTWVRRIASMPAENIRTMRRGFRRIAEQSGFRMAIEMGADLDALAHTGEATKAWRRTVAEVGLAEAVKRRDEAFR